MIPVIHCTTALARALGAKPGWPMNPPQRDGIYIIGAQRGQRSHFFWPAEKRR